VRACVCVCVASLTAARRRLHVFHARDVGRPQSASVVLSRRASLIIGNESLNGELSTRVTGLSAGRPTHGVQLKLHKTHSIPYTCQLYTSCTFSLRLSRAIDYIHTAELTTS